MFLADEHETDVDDVRTPSASIGAVRSTSSRRIVFETRSAVMIALSRFQSGDGQWLTRRRGSTQNLRPSTERAALAVLARRYLDADQFTRLYAAFESLIPAALLFGLDRLTRSTGRDSAAPTNLPAENARWLSIDRAMRAGCRSHFRAMGFCALAEGNVAADANTLLLSRACSGHV